MTHPLIQSSFDLFQGQAATICGSLVAKDEYGIDEFTDVDVFFDSSTALHFGLAHAKANGFSLDDWSQRKLTFNHRWGGKRFHVETYRLTDSNGVELNLTHKLLGGNSVRGTASTLLSFDFGLLLVGYDCLADSIEDARLDLRGGFFPEQHAVGGPYPMVPDKARAWVRGEFGQNSAIRQAERTAKYAMRGYDLSLVVPDLVLGYRKAALDQENRGTPNGSALSGIYLKLADLLEDEEWQEIRDGCLALGFDAPVPELQAVFD